MNPNTAELEFLRECDRRKSQCYDSSEKIAADLEEKYRHRVDSPVQLWRDYLRCKFDFLMALEHDPPLEADEFAGRLGKAGVPDRYFVEFLEGWQRNREKERLAYLYRYSQVPSGVVHSEWYSQDVTSCFQWCKRRRDEVNNLQKQAEVGSWADHLGAIYGRLFQPDPDIDTDLLLAALYRHGISDLAAQIEEMCHIPDLPATPSRIAEITERCRLVLAEIRDRMRAMVGDYGGIPTEHGASNGFLTDLSLQLLRTLYTEDFDETALIQAFINSTKEHFACEVCDFMDVVDNGSRIEWRTGTVQQSDMSETMQELPPDEQRRRVKQRESYRLGEGISGTILLRPYDPSQDLWMHVGSNDVLNDPRQSQEHRHGYEKDIYPGVLRFDGQIHNFWMFPVYHDKRLVGAFRVVNKLDRGGKLQFGGWPYLTRVELALVAQWFSRFFEVAEPQMRRQRDVWAYMSWVKQIENVKARLDLDWVDTEFFAAILRRLVRMIGKREEKRGLGCSVLIGKQRKGERVAKELPEYPMITAKVGSIEYPYGELEGLVDIFDPLAGTFVFNERGEFKRVAALRAVRNRHRVSGYEAVEAITKPKGRLSILLPVGAGSLLFYQGGRRVAELYQKERASAGEDAGASDWEFRVVDDLWRAISENCDLRQSDAKIILETCLEMSSRKWGGLLILGDISKSRFSMETVRTCLGGSDSIESMGASILGQFAKMDGATMIDSRGIVQHVNTMVWVLEDPGELKHFKSRGARHKTAEKVSRLQPEALVVVISENGGISVLKAGEAKLIDY